MNIRKTAVAAYEALPAILLAAALLMPALAALAGPAGENSREAAAPAQAEIGQAIAEQGNRALAQIRAESRESLRKSLALPSR